MSTPIEHLVIPLGERHQPHNWEYANAAAREAATGFVTGDVGGVALQLDDFTRWTLIDDSPVTWQADNGPATQIVESAGPATLDIGAIVDGEFLKRVGTDIVSDSVPGGAEAGANSDITSMDGLTGALETPTRIDFAEGAAPATPGAGKVSVYAKTDGKVYSKDDAGTETELGGGAGSIGGSTGASDNRILRADGTGGSTVQSSAVSIDDTGNTLPVTTSASDLGGNSNRWNQFWANDILASGTGAAGGRIRFFGSGGGAAEIASNTNRKTVNFIDGVNGNTGTIGFPPHTPSQFVADQNNYTEEGGNSAGFFRWSSDASRTVTGLSISQASGDIHVIVNVGSNDIVLAHESASSTDVNRFLCSTGASVTLGANQAADIIYDGTTQRWRVFKRN